MKINIIFEDSAVVIDGQVSFIKGDLVRPQDDAYSMHWYEDYGELHLENPKREIPAAWELFEPYIQIAQQQIDSDRIKAEALKRSPEYIKQQIKSSAGNRILEAVPLHKQMNALSEGDRSLWDKYIDPIRKRSDELEAMVDDGLISHVDQIEDYWEYG